jgi:hypothetical protein
MMQNHSFCQHSSALAVNNRFQFIFKHSTIPCTIDQMAMILVVLEVEPIKVSKQGQHHFAGRRHTFESFGPGQWHRFPLYAFTFACRFIVVHPCFITCDNSLQESLSMISLQKLHALSMHACLCSSASCFGTHLTQILLIPKVLVDDGICRSTADVQFVGYISDSNLSVSWTKALTRSTLSTVHEVVGWPEQSSSMMLVLPL